MVSPLIWPQPLKVLSTKKSHTTQWWEEFWSLAVWAPSIKQELSVRDWAVTLGNCTYHIPTANTSHHLLKNSQTVEQSWLWVVDWLDQASCRVLVFVKSWTITQLQLLRYNTMHKSPVHPVYMWSSTNRQRNARASYEYTMSIHGK